MGNNEVHLIPVTVEEVIEEQAQQQTPYGVKMIHAPEVWEEVDGGSGNVIAVLDTGCQLDHPDLKGQMIDGRNFTEDYDGDPDNYNDNHYHGTHVCGTIAAMNNDVGVVGVAPKAKLLVVKVLNSQGQGSYQNIIDGIHYAIDWRGPNDERVRVISMSLGGPNDEPGLHDAIKKAVDENILVVCAAGNSGDGKGDTPEIEYPGYYKEVIEVGAVDSEKKMADFSDSNKRVNLVAPGVNVLSTYSGGKYAKLSGTSMATPHVSAAAALLANQLTKQLGRAPTERELFAQLNKQTTSLGYERTLQGNGLLDLTADGKDRGQYEGRHIAVKPVDDGYTVELGFERDREKAMTFAKKLADDLKKVSGAKVDIQTYQLTQEK